VQPFCDAALASHPQPSPGRCTQRMQSAIPDSDTHGPGQDAASAAARSRPEPQARTPPSGLARPQTCSTPEGRAPAAACRPPAPPAPPALRRPGPARPPRTVARSARRRRPPRPRPRRRPRRPRAATPRARPRRQWARTTCSPRRCPGCRRLLPRPRLRRCGAVRLVHQQASTLVRCATILLEHTQNQHPQHHFQACPAQHFTPSPAPAQDINGAPGQFLPCTAAAASPAAAPAAAAGWAWLSRLLGTRPAAGPPPVPCPSPPSTPRALPVPEPWPEPDPGSPLALAPPLLPPPLLPFPARAQRRWAEHSATANSASVQRQTPDALARRRHGWQAAAQSTPRGS